MKSEWLGIIVAIGVIVGLFGFHYIAEFVVGQPSPAYYDYCTKMNIVCR